MAFLDTFKFWGKALEKQKEDLEHKFYSTMHTNEVLLQRLRSNEALTSYLFGGERLVEYRAEALFRYVNNNTFALKAKNDQNARELITLWYKLARLWTNVEMPYLRWRRAQPTYDPRLTSLPVAEEKARLVLDGHLLPRGLTLVAISFGDLEVTPQFINVMKTGPSMGFGAGDMRFAGEEYMNVENEIKA